MNIREHTIYLRKEIQDRECKSNLISIILSSIKKAILKQKFWIYLFSRICRKINIKETTFFFKKLPNNFDGFKILFISDFHLEITPNPVSKLKEVLLDVKYDIVILGGDYFDNPSFFDKDKFNDMLNAFNKDVFAVLGNHDSIDTMINMEKMDVKVLLNQSIDIIINNESITLTGIDDVSYFDCGMQDVESRNNLNNNKFKIMVSHSPDFLTKSSLFGYDFQLSGHTHGGQFKLSDKIKINHTDFSFASHGVWNYFKLKGYTTSGIGNSYAPIRNIIPEIALIELKKT